MLESPIQLGRCQCPNEVSVCDWPTLQLMGLTNVTAWGTTEIRTQTSNYSPSYNESVKHCTGNLSSMVYSFRLVKRGSKGAGRHTWRRTRSLRQYQTQLSLFRFLDSTLWNPLSCWCMFDGDICMSVLHTDGASLRGSSYLPYVPQNSAKAIFYRFFEWPHGWVKSWLDRFVLP